MVSLSTTHTVHTMTDHLMIGPKEVIYVTNNPREYNADEVLEHFGLAEGISLEADPSGLSSKDPGSKLDAGKIDVNLLWESFPNALLAVAEVATYGAAKYTRGGWKEVENGKVRYGSAEGRHKLHRNAGEVIDSGPKGSQLPHRYHEAWNSLAQLELAITQGDLS